jgi:hypothetical protein
VAGALKVVFETLGIYRPDTWAPFASFQAQLHERRVTSTAIRSEVEGTGFAVVDEFSYDWVSAALPIFYKPTRLLGQGGWLAQWHYRLNRVATARGRLRRVSMFYGVLAEAV